MVCSRWLVAMTPTSGRAEWPVGTSPRSWGSTWELPDLGPIGSHGLANPRDFLFPVAYIDEEHSTDYQCRETQRKYDLTEFALQNASSIDHTNPSVNTTLTASPGTSMLLYDLHGISIVPIPLPPPQPKNSSCKTTNHIVSSRVCHCHTEGLPLCRH